VTGSNFFGLNAGHTASDSSYSNFIGVSAGFGTINVTNSNFIGNSAGYNATGTTQSNFIGTSAGSLASDSDNSNFFGYSAGQNSKGAEKSNFIGYYAGRNLTGVTNANFIGYYAGQEATNATNSNFIGDSAGNGATSSSNSNFIGYQAGVSSTSSSYSNFIGYAAGGNVKSSTYSNFIGNFAGGSATGVTNSNFIGNNAGNGATSSSNSNFFGYKAGDSAISVTNSNFMGYEAGYIITGVTVANFIGRYAGKQASNASYSNFIGDYAGYQANNSNNSNFIGEQAGYYAKSSDTSNFIGVYAGHTANKSPNSNFIGPYAGQNAINSPSSNFIGNLAGYDSNYCNNSNFIGNGAGYKAEYSEYSNFIGQAAGYISTGSTYSNFIGYYAGRNVQYTNYSNLIGYQAGFGVTGNKIGSNNIIIGTNISLPNATTNSINLGGVLFGTGTYSATTGDPSITAVSGGKIGIGVVTPLETLHVNGSVVLSKDSSYTSLSDGATTPVPNGSGGTMVYDSVTTSFYGWIGTSWSKLNGDSYTTGFTYSANTFTIKRNNGLSDLTASINSMTGLTVSGTISATTISGDTIYANDFPQLPYVDNQTIDTYTSGSDSYIRLKDIVTAPSGGTRTFYGNTVLSNSGTTTPTEILDVNGNGRFRNIGSSASAGALHRTADGTLTISTSDERLKTNVTTLEHSLNKIKQLRGVTYNWTEEPNGDKRIGLIAQEVNTIVPELTFVNNNTEEKYMGVHYDNTVALLIEGVKELNNKVESNNVTNNTYTSLSDGATNPVPDSGAGTMTFDPETSSFYGWTGSVWKKLHT